MTNCPSAAILRLIGTEAVGEATLRVWRDMSKMSRLPEDPRGCEVPPHRTRLTPARTPPSTSRSGHRAPVGRAERAWFTCLGTGSKTSCRRESVSENALVDPSREGALVERSAGVVAGTA